MVRVPATAAKWATSKRYCDAAGLSMGRAISRDPGSDAYSDGFWARERDSRRRPSSERTRLRESMERLPLVGPTSNDSKSLGSLRGGFASGASSRSHRVCLVAQFGCSRDRRQRLRHLAC
jgi:hypothetical protein